MSEVRPGVWRLRAYIGRNSKGNPVQEQETVSGTKSEASKRLAGLVVKSQGRTAEGSGVTVEQMLDRWLDYIEPTRSPQYVSQARQKIKKHITPVLGTVRLSKLTARQLDKLYADGLASGLSPSTVRMWHAFLSAALHTAERWGWIDRNPTRLASPPAAARPKTQTPTPAEIQAMVHEAQLEDSVLAGAIALAAFTGARRGELCALRWSDVDLLRGEVDIARSVSVVDGVRHIRGTKTHNTRRVAVGEEAVATLAWIRRMQEQLAGDAGVERAPDPFVLSYRADGSEPVNPDTISHRFARYSNGWRFHDLRHFVATTLIAEGVDVRTVAERLGHAQTTMTLNRYAHALPQLDRHAADVLESALALGGEGGK